MHYCNMYNRLSEGIRSRRSQVQMLILLLMVHANTEGQLLGSIHIFYISQDLSNINSWFNTGVLISPQPDQKGNKLQHQKISSSYILFIIIIGGILVLFIYITRLSSNEIFLPSNKIHRKQVGLGLISTLVIYKSVIL